MDGVIEIAVEKSIMVCLCHRGWDYTGIGEYRSSGVYMAMVQYNVIWNFCIEIP